MARHSGAKKVKTTIKKLNKAIVMTIEDNGIGFSEKVAAKKRTLGVLGMKERASVMGGEYQITGEGGKGTSIIVRVPILKNNFQE